MSFSRKNSRLIKLLARWGTQPEFLTFLHPLITSAAQGNKLQDAVHFLVEVNGMFNILIYATPPGTSDCL